MQQRPVVTASRELAEKIHTMKISSFAAIKGISPAEAATLALRKASAMLVQVVSGTAASTEKVAQVDYLEGQLHIAALVGAISAQELKDYLGLLDGVHHLIEIG